MTISATETDALKSTRRWLMIVGTCVWISTTLLIVRYQWSDLSAVEHALVLSGSSLLIVAVVMSGRPRFLWLFPAGQVCFVLCAFVASSSSPNWLALTTLSSWLGYFLIALTPRNIGFFFIPIAGLVTITGWKSKPNIVVPGALEVFGGWVVFIQLLGGAAALWWAWNTLRREAAEGDQRTKNLEIEAAHLIDLQERARHWRKAATHIHESVLNTLRYVLSNEKIDRKRLNDEISYAVFGRDPLMHPSGSTCRVLAEEILSSQFERCEFSLIGTIPDVPMGGEVFETLRSSLLELVRNIDRHSGERNIAVSMVINNRESLVITLSGGTPPKVQAPMGIGRSTVVDRSLQEIGASLHTEGLEGGQSEISIVIALKDLVPAPNVIAPIGFPPFDKARLLVTFPLATMSVFGCIYFFREMWWGSGVAEWSSWCGFTGVVIAAFVVIQRRRIHPWVGILMVLFPALVPMFLLRDQFACVDSSVIAPILTVSGYSVMILAAWSGRLAGVVGLAIWAYGGVKLVMSFPSNCRDSVALALLNSLVVLPIILIVSFIGAKAYRKAADRTRAMRQVEVVERSRVQASNDLNDQLDQAVSRALRTLTLVAQGAEMTLKVREELEVQDGRIRSVIQVDPERDGAFAVLMRTLVEEVAELGIRANVKAMISSQDTRPIDREVDRLLYRLFLANRAYATQVQVFTDGVEDHLVLTVSRKSLWSVGLSPGQHLDLGEISVQVEVGELVDDDANSHAVILSRKISLTTVKST